MMDCDVAIVGAGAARLALGRELTGHGLTVVILEARGRVGGRALTDIVAFGAPFDRGCAYLHHGKKNPFHHLALRQARAAGAGEGRPPRGDLARRPRGRRGGP